MPVTGAVVTAEWAGIEEQCMRVFTPATAHCHESAERERSRGFHGRRSFLETGEYVNSRSAEHPERIGRDGTGRPRKYGIAKDNRGGRKRRAKIVGRCRAQGQQQARSEERR